MNNRDRCLGRKIRSQNTPKMYVATCIASSIMKKWPESCVHCKNHEDVHSPLMQNKRKLTMKVQATSSWPKRHKFICKHAGLFHLLKFGLVKILYNHVKMLFPFS